MSHVSSHIDFRANVGTVTPHTIQSVQRATGRFLDQRQAVVDVVGDERWEALRQAGHDLRLHTLNHLDHYLALLEQQVTAAGGHVHWARDAAEARQIVIEIAQAHDVKRAVKVKSMASEEIDLNQALTEAGIHARETDLGEYIVQLAGQRPSHILAPATHLSKEDIAALFEQKLGVDAPPDPQVLAAIARTRLREEFLSADMGISSANFLVAETGTLVLVTNEGNGRMCTSVPPLLVTVTTIDKVVPDWESLTVLLKLLARSATGQKLSTYTSFISGPQGSDGETGPREWHLVLMDNGRSRILADERTRETLLCIRCGACLNKCPVYNHVGGHSYGWVYSGPIGAILATQLLGTPAAADLPFASSLCGACSEICPMKIPIPEILIHLRHRVAEGDAQEPPVISPVLRAAADAGALALGTPWLYEPGSQLLRAAQAPFYRSGWLPWLPPPVDRWTSVRPFPAFDARFRASFRSRTPAGRVVNARNWLGLAACVAAIATLLAYLFTRPRRRAGQ